MPVLWSGLGLRHTPPGAATPLFVGLDLRIGPGTTLLRGGDGRGKTTLLRIIADALRPQAGRTGACGGGVFWADPRGEGPGLPAVQQTPVDWWAGQAQRWPDWSARALALHVEGFGLAGHAGKRMEQLSTGTRRKVLLAAGFACGAALVLVDEPVAGLDRPSVDHLRRCWRASGPPTVGGARRGGRALRHAGRSSLEPGGRTGRLTGRALGSIMRRVAGGMQP